MKKDRVPFSIMAGAPIGNSHLAVTGAPPGVEARQASLYPTIMAGPPIRNLSPDGDGRPAGDQEGKFPSYSIYLKFQEAFYA